MKKIIFTLTKFSRKNGNTKTKGIGYINGNDFMLALKSNTDMPYVKIFEDTVGQVPKVPNRVNEFAGYLLKALSKGKPEYDTQFIDGKQRKVIKVNDKIYMV